MNTIDRLIKNLEKIEIEIYHELFKARRYMIQRTQQGKDKDEKPFKPYSKQYSKLKAERGRQNHPVNLTYRFQMLGSIKIGHIQGGGKIYIGDMTERNKALKHIKGWGTPKRNFWGLGKYEKKILEKIKKVVCAE